MKNRESSPSYRYEDNKSSVTVLERESISVDIEVKVLNDNEGYKYPNHPENFVIPEVNVSNETDDTESNHEYSENAEDLSLILKHSLDMMNELKASRSYEDDKDNLALLYDLREDMDFSIDSFGLWEDYENPKGTPALYKLLGSAPLSLKAQEILNRDDNKLKEFPEERNKYRLVLAEFQDRLHTVVETNPNINTKDLAAALAEVTSEFSEIDDENLVKFIDNKIRGVRNEQVFKNAFENSAGTTIKPSTPHEDIKGIDYKLETSTDIYYIDVKTSLPGRKRDEKANSPSDMYRILEGKYKSIRENRRIVIRPEVDDSMFKKDSFQLKDEYIDQVNNDIRTAIHLAKSDYDKAPRQ